MAAHSKYTVETTEIHLEVTVRLSCMCYVTHLAFPALFMIMSFLPELCFLAVFF